jgi:hypothetical protein
MIHLLVILLFTIVTLGLGRLSLLSAVTARTSTTERRAEGEVDVLLGVETDNERGNVDDLLSNTDMTLADQDAGVVDGLGETELVNLGLFVRDYCQRRRTEMGSWIERTWRRRSKKSSTRRAKT